MLFTLLLYGNFQNWVRSCKKLPSEVFTDIINHLRLDMNAKTGLLLCKKHKMLISTNHGGCSLCINLGG